MPKTEFILMTSTSDSFLFDAKEVKSFPSLRSLREHLEQAHERGEDLEAMWVDVLEDGRVKGWACIGVDYEGKVVLN